MTEPTGNAPSRQVLAWQICTGCANTRELLVTLDEAARLHFRRPIAEREKHADCYPRGGATRSEWVTNGARWAPSARAGDDRG